MVDLRAGRELPTSVRTTIVGEENYPLVQVAYEDAAYYATWADKRLPRLRVTKFDFERQPSGSQ